MDPYRPNTLSYRAPRDEKSQVAYASLASTWRPIFFTGIVLLVGSAAYIATAPSKRPRAAQSNCTSRLMDFYSGVLRFAQDHNERYPDSFFELVTTYYVDTQPRQFICPQGHETPPPT